LVVTAFHLAAIRAFKSGSKMSRNRQHSLVLGLAILSLTMLVLAPLTLGQSASAPQAGIPVPTDWSHRHVIFSRPGTTEQAARIEKDPRYWQQRYRSQLPLRAAPAVENGEAFARQSPLESKRERESKNRKLHRDWAVSMGSGASSGADNFPATFSTLLNTASCASAAQPDFVIYSTGLDGSSTQASIVAYDNLYSGCTPGTVPSVYWAYNTGGQILTSPVYSLDGTQVAFVQTNVANEGIIVWLKWAASTTETAGSPMTLTAVSRAAYETCAPPCMTTKFLRDSSDVIDNDTSSSVFYDYGSDTAYVGDALGWLYKFTPFFSATPTEIRTVKWPVHLNANAPLDSPVYDFVSGNVFVGDMAGFLYRVDSSTASVTTSGELDFGAGIVEGPTVNPTLGLVYVFASRDGTTNCSGSACAAVYQLSTSFMSGSVGLGAAVGNSVGSTPPNPNPLYGGDFDNNYLTSANGTGNLYVCGNTGGDPTLYQIAINAGVMGIVTPGPVLASGTTPCSPVTDILNPNVSGGATEWFFASAESGGTSTACAGGGCIFNFKDTSWKPSTTYSVGQEVLDSHFQIQVVVLAFGPSGATTPDWKTTAGDLTTDGEVAWLDQGVQSAFTPAWVADNSYSVGATILDSHNNIQAVTVAGTSGGTSPTFSQSVGGTTTGDGNVTWTNVGAIATAAMAAAGGTSGIVVDNTVETFTGASQVYFSTLSDEICSTSGAPLGGCAVQASQSDLQ
jgi:hypothetical protein